MEFEDSVHYFHWGSKILLTKRGRQQISSAAGILPSALCSIFNMSLSDFEEWKKIIDFFRKGKKERPSINTVDEERIVWKNVNRLIGTRFNIDGNKPEVTIGPSFGSRGDADAEEWDEKKERVISVMEIKRSSNLKLISSIGNLSLFA